MEFFGILRYRPLQPIVISTRETIPKGIEKELEKLEIRGRIVTIQTTGIVKIDYDTLEGPSDIRRFAVTKTPVIYHNLTPQAVN